MPNIKSAKKRVVVSGVKTLHNKNLVSGLRTTVKKAELAIANNAEDKASAVTLAVKKIDQACAKGLIHKNCAARKKSQLALKGKQAG